MQMKGKTKKTWQDNIDQRFTRFRYGKYSTRQAERRTLLHIVNDIASLNIEAVCFSQLKQADLARLVKYWRSKGNTRQTAYKKLNMINKYYPTQAVKSLVSYTAVKKEIARRKKPILSMVQLSDISNQPLQFLYQGQRLFGLAFKEVLNLKPSLLCEKTIKVLRLHAFNGRERHIGVNTTAQQAWVAAYCEVFPSTYLSCSQPSLTRLHRQYCRSLGIPGEYFRYCYMFWRYCDLLSQYHCIDENIRRKLFKQLRTELGYYDNAPIKEKITCLSALYAMPPTVYIS